MKKKIIIVITIVVAAILLIPVPLRLKDGGTVRYQAVLYSVSDVHRLAPTENDVCYEDGIIIEIFGIEVFNNVVPSISENDSAEENDLIPMVMVNGELYLDTGYNNTGIHKCGTPDGKITSSVKTGERPTKNNQSNFGIGYDYQYGTTEGTIEICMNDQWRIFATEKVRREIQFGLKPSVQVYDVELSYANWTNSDEIRQNALNAKILVQNIANHMPIYKFNTIEELEQFKTDFSEEFELDNNYGEVPSFNEVITKYDKKFFEETCLFLVYIDSPNSTHRFGLNGISWDEKSFCIYVEETTDEESVDTALSGWFLTVAVPSASVTNCTEFDAVFDKIELTIPTVQVLREPSKLIVNSGDITIEALRGTSSWFYVDDSGELVAIMGDGNHTLLKKDFTPALDLVPTYFSSIDPLMVRLQFGVTPNVVTPDKVTVRCWSEECWGNAKAKSEELPVTIENGNVFVQLKDGNYIYEVIADWEKGKRSFSGSVCYSFYTVKPTI